MSDIENKEGFQPEIRREIARRDKALSGDMVLVMSPATLGSSAAAVNAAIGGAAAKFTRDVVIELQAANGERHGWFDGTFVIAIADTSAGTAAIVSTTATFVNGRCVITITYTGTWTAADTCTLTITGSTKLGYTISNKTSVDTLVA